MPRKYIGMTRKYTTGVPWKSNGMRGKFPILPEKSMEIHWNALEKHENPQRCQGILLEYHENPLESYGNPLEW